jgi:hypothetical protein
LKMTQPNLAQGEKPLYLCAQCNEPVFLVDGIVYRPCGHNESPVLANLEALVRGASSVS